MSQMHIFTNTSEVHFGPKSTANFRFFKCCSLSTGKATENILQKAAFSLKKSIYSCCTFSFFFCTLCLQPFIHIWGFIDLLTKLCEIPSTSEPQATGGHFLLQLRLACLASLPPPKSFSVSLFTPSGKLFLHFSHPLHMILLFPAAHTENVYIHNQSPGKHSFLTSHAHLRSCNVSHSSCYSIPLRNLIASYISPKLRVSEMPFTITMGGGLILVSHRY